MAKARYVKIELTQGDYTVVNEDFFLNYRNHSFFRSKRKDRCYASVYIQGNLKLLHRVVMNAKQGQIVDHINGDPLDNRRENLRIVTHAQNAQNTRKQSGNQSSKFKGVSYNKSLKQYQAYIKKGGKRYHIGYYDYELAAAKAYDSKAKLMFGKYAKLNLEDAFPVSPIKEENIISVIPRPAHRRGKDGRLKRNIRRGVYNPKLTYQEIPLNNGLVAIVDNEDFARVNAFVWTCSKSKGYRSVFRRDNLNSFKYVSLSRFIMQDYINENELVVDHISGNTLDNRKTNLRVISKKQNSQNTASRIGSSSRYLGVSFRKDNKKWQVTLKNKKLGCYKSERKAAMVYNIFAALKYGKYARMNEIILSKEEVARFFEIYRKRTKEPLY